MDSVCVHFCVQNNSELQLHHDSNELDCWAIECYHVLCFTKTGLMDAFLMTAASRHHEVEIK